MASASRLLALLFTDLVDSSALKAPNKLGDTGYMERVAMPHVRIFRELLQRFPDAREIDYTGDGFFASFARASDAVNFALLFQLELRAQSWEGVPAQIRSRIGIHLGEVLEFQPGAGDERLLASHAADMCARLMGLAGGGQILLTRAAFDNARQFIQKHPQLEGASAPELRWLAHGRYLFKGREEPMEVFEVGATGTAPLRQPPDSEKAKRSVSAEEEATLGWRPALGLEVIGRPEWILEQRLGEGGFGEVWLARQTRTKEPRVFKFCFDADRVRSLKRELTLFRLLREGLGEREDIVRLFDVRLDQFPFFIESEYVSSGDLNRWIEKRGGVAAIPIAERVNLIARVARSVSAAHSLGIIHKDLKPANVFMKDLPGGAYQPVLADFGIGVLAQPEIAREHDITITGFTADVANAHESSASHTRLYAPPEAISHSPPTVKWDIYALGVMLYQLLAGDLTRPLGEGWSDEIEDPLLREDIAACVRRDLDRRLDSASALAERLETLDKRRAQREAEKRAAADRKRIQQLRLRLALASAFLILAITLGTVSWFGWRRARTEQKRAEEARKTALEHADLTLDTVNRILVEAQQNLKEVAGGHKVQRALTDLAEHVRQKHEEIQKSSGAQSAGTERLAAVAQLQLGEVWKTLGKTTEARQAFERALKLFEPIAARSPNDRQFQVDLSVMVSRLGDLAAEEGDMKVARLYYDRDLAISEKLAAGSTNDVEKLNYLQSLNQVARVAQRQGDHASAQQTFERSLALSREIEKRHPGKWSPKKQTLATLGNLGDLAIQNGDLEHARSAFEQALAIAREYLAGDPKNPEANRNSALLSAKLGTVLMRQNQFEPAAAEFARSLALFETLSRDDPENAKKQRDIAVTLRSLGEAKKALNQLDAAEGDLQRSVSIIQKLCSLDEQNDALQRDLANRYLSLGEIQIERKNLDQARNQFEKAREIYSRLATAHPNDSVMHNDLSNALDGLGHIALQQSDLPSARTWFQQSLDIMVPIEEQSHSITTQQDIAGAHIQLGRIEQQVGDKSSARKHFTIAQSILVAMDKEKQLPANKQSWLTETTEALKQL